MFNLFIVLTNMGLPLAKNILPGIDPNDEPVGLKVSINNGKFVTRTDSEIISTSLINHGRGQVIIS